MVSFSKFKKGKHSNPLWSLRTIFYLYYNTRALAGDQVFGAVAKDQFL